MMNVNNRWFQLIASLIAMVMIPALYGLYALAGTSGRSKPTALIYLL
jgi:hypothetical protein